MPSPKGDQSAASGTPAQEAGTQGAPDILNDGARSKQRGPKPLPDSAHYNISWESTFQRDADGRPKTYKFRIPCTPPVRAYYRLANWWSSMKAKLRPQDNSE